MRGSSALLLAALAITCMPSGDAAIHQVMRPSPKAQPQGYAPCGRDDILPWARYCVATSRRRAARRGRRPGR